MAHESIRLSELLPNLPAQAGFNTVNKAIEVIAVPEGICIIQPYHDVHSWRSIETKEEYRNWLLERNRVIARLEKTKELASAAWMNRKR